MTPREDRGSVIVIAPVNLLSYDSKNVTMIKINRVVAYINLAAHDVMGIEMQLMRSSRVDRRNSLSLILGLNFNAVLRDCSLTHVSCKALLLPYPYLSVSDVSLVACCRQTGENTT